MSVQTPSAESSRIDRRSFLIGSGLFVSGMLAGGAAWEGLRRPVLGLFGTISPPDVIVSHWHTYTSLDNHGPTPTRIPWISFEGDPTASADQKTWHIGGIVGTPSDEFHSMLQATPGSIPAAAFALSDTQYKATQLGAFDNLGQVEQDNTKYAAVIFMIGHGSLNASLGFLDPDGNFIGSPNARRLARTDISDLSGNLANVPILRG